MELGTVNKRMSISLKVCSLAVIIGMVFTLEICPKPVGPKMCQDLCQRTAGCTSYVYSASSLSCYIGHSGNAQKCVPEESQWFKVKVTPAKLVPCPGNFKVIESRTRGLQCVGARRQEKRTTPLRRNSKKKMTRILLYSKYSSSKTNLQVSIHTKKMKTFPEPPCCSQLYAVAYIQAISRIIVSTGKGLMTALLDSSRYTTLNSSLRLFDMAVDDDKGLVFMLQQGSGSKNRLIAMNTINFGYTQVHTFIGAKHLAIDAEGNVCYVTTLVSIMYLNNDGQNVKVLHKGNQITKATINPLLNVLYFIQNKRIMTLSLSDNEVAMPKELTVRDLLYNDNALYVMTYKGIEKITGNKTTVICSGKILSGYRMLLLP